MTSYVLSVLGDDRAGLVEALAAVVSEHGGNWERSHLAQLSGKFAGLVQVSVPEGQGDAFEAALQPLEARGLLDITVGSAGQVATTSPRRPLTFGIVGNDHPGIVHEVSKLLASLDVNIVELITATESAAMDGATLFRARAEVQLPDGLTADELVDRLESVANDLMVDLDLDESR